MAIKLAAAVAVAAAAAQTEMIDADTPDGGFLQVYSGTRPASPDTAAAGTKLVEFELPNPAFGTPVDGALGATAVANAVTPVAALANGTASWFRVTDNSGDPVFDGDVSDAAGSGDLKISNTAVTSGIDVSVVSLTFLQPKA